MLGPNFPRIHSLLFVDDLLVCGHATSQEAYSMAQIIHHFCALSGQTPNWSKSAILFSAHVNQVAIAALKTFSLFPLWIEISLTWATLSFFLP